jgi:medium-chain acyl-[acyl-carrier-protein] hydrolase
MVHRCQPLGPTRCRSRGVSQMQQTMSSYAEPLGERRADDVRLICFPPAGCGASYFRQCQAVTAPGLEICPVQLPGRENRIGEAPYTSFAELVPQLAHSLQPYLRTPFAFFGHSLGAIVAFEVARHLRSRYNVAPSALYVSGCRAPQVPRLRPVIGHLPERHFIGEIAKSYDFPRDVFADIELSRLMLPVIRADFQLFETYTYSAAPPLGCRIAAFAGRDDRTLTHAAAGAWCHQTASRFDLHIVPGNHFFQTSEKVDVLAKVASDLADAARRSHRKDLP